MRATVGCRSLILVGIGSLALACGGESTRPPVGTKLAFRVQPSASVAGVAISPTVEVEIQNADGSRATNATSRVTIALEPGFADATLSGTRSVDAVGGVATFGDLAIDVRGSSYRLVATGAGLQQATSNPFAVSLSYDALTAGVAHACGIAAAHTYCMGFNGLGHLGDGSTTPRLIPTLTRGAQTLVSIDAGVNHTCGLTAAGAAWCWGGNGTGQLGDGTSIARLSPTPVSGGMTFASITAGEDHTCGLTTAGVAFCWGRNSFGQLGNGTTSSTPALTPVAVTGGLTFSAISAGLAHTCALTAAHTVYCWGANDAGQVGDGTSTTKTAPTLVTGGVSFVTLSAGASHTCALTSAGAGWCWGANFDGQVGDGTLMIRPTPTPVSGNITFASLVAGYAHTCGTESSGATHCWGVGGDGQLGRGQLGSSTTPVAVAGGLAFRVLALGRYHTCALTGAGEMYCWGWNGAGQFGDGTELAHSLTPARAGQ